ncbi:hypothetical protein [Jiella sp. M17.18]|uniref:hypothetical protein n=1 Tax=Jiella sp. M17.18 TaxID=3234247 RepID=UPI0034E03FE4
MITYPGDEAFIDAWGDLVRRTVAVVPPRDFLPPHVDADHARTPPWPWRPMPLDGEWERYGEAWQSFLYRNPRARLASMMASISETHDSASWPAGWEDRIRDWVRAGCPGERPFDDRLGIDTPIWRVQLITTAAAAGRGWVYYDEGRLRWIDR